jgi:hypothetical protein
MPSWQLQLNNNDWYSGRRRFAGTHSRGQIGTLAVISFRSVKRCVLALHVCGGVDESVAMRELKNPDQYIRA